MRKHLAIIGTIVTISAVSACSGNDAGDMQDTGLGTPPAAAMPGADTTMGAGPIIDSTGMQGLQVDTLLDTMRTDTLHTDTMGTTPPPR